jgi:hypothetical protein
LFCVSLSVNSFPLSRCGNPYPVAEKLPTVVVFFSSNPESWLMARSYCLFTEVSQRSSLGWSPNINTGLCGFGLIQVCILAFCQKDVCVLTVVVVKSY